MNFDLIAVSPSKQTAMAVLLLMALLAIVRSLLSRSRDRTSLIDLDMLLLEWNPVSQRYEMSIIRVLALAAFVLTAWMMIYLTMAGKMTEGYLGIFNTAWVFPLVAAIIWGKKPPLPAVPGPTTKIVADNVTVENPPK